MSLVKVSVENAENTIKKLHEIDKSKTLEENINSICELFEKPSSTTVYGLKLIATNDGKNMHTYISEDNFKDIKDGYFLQLVFSVSYYVKTIFQHVNDDYKEKSFSDLYNLSVDPEFIKELVRTGKHVTVIELFTNSELEDYESTACLITIVHLFQRNHVSEIKLPFLEKILSIVKHKTNNELVKYALSVVHKILCHRDVSFGIWKEEIIKELPIQELMKFIKRKDSMDLQYGALLVINTMIRCCKGDKRQQMIKEINLRQNRETIYQEIIVTNNVDKSMARELFVYQTFLLSSFADALNSTITVNDTDMFERNEFEITDSEVKKLTLLMDFEDAPIKNKAASIDDLLATNDLRISLASMGSTYSEESSRFSNRVQSVMTNESIDYDNLRISVLTVEALRHYKKFHYKNFWQSQIEEKVYEPGILASSERIIRMLAKILHIGNEPEKSVFSLFYQPTIFTCSSKTPFFLELFSRTMWLLSKTRREMKASTILDYEKVLQVLAKQIKLVLEEKPMDFKKLTAKMIEINYDKVVEKWQKEKQEELRNVLDTHPSVQVLKQRFVEENEKVVFEQRMTFIRTETKFRKFNEKKVMGYFKARLSTSGRELHISDYYETAKISSETAPYSIANITHIVEGQACPHVKNNSVKNPQLAFSIIFNNEEWINFTTTDAKTACYWLDALSLLLGKEKRSEYYKKELNDLVEMDLMLHLLELQNVSLPKRPPPVPKPPFEVRPPVPPKPVFYSNRVSNVSN